MAAKVKASRCRCQNRSGERCRSCRRPLSTEADVQGLLRLPWTSVVLTLYNPAEILSPPEIGVSLDSLASQHFERTNVTAQQVEVVWVRPAHRVNICRVGVSVGGLEVAWCRNLVV